MAGEISQSLAEELALRLEDAAGNTFTDVIKYKALNTAQLQLAYLLNNVYLTEFEQIDDSIALSTDYVSFSSLSKNVLKGNAGITKAAVKFGGSGDYSWCTRIDMYRIKRSENSCYEGTDDNPLFYTYQQRVYFMTTSPVDDVVKILYLAVPDTISASVDPVINASLYPLLLTMAESFCWNIDGDLARSKAALEMGFNEIKSLNERIVPTNSAIKRAK